MNRQLSVATPSGVPPLLPVLLAAAAFGMLFAYSRRARPWIARIPGRSPSQDLRGDRQPMPKAAVQRAAARRLNTTTGVLAIAVLADSAIEHYRGSFQNRAMYTPLVVGTLTLAASLFGASDQRLRRHRWRDFIYVLAAGTGAAGMGFHGYNILKRPGGPSWLNFFYAAPIGAPAALALAGVFGRAAERVREDNETLLMVPAGRLLAAVSAIGLAGSAGEAALLHFRGAYHNPAMLLPVSVPPVAAALLGAAAVHPSRRIRHLAERWLRVTAFLGCAGVGFHAFGVSRNMGGWRNWSQNILNGPPLPAPPSFTALAASGLGALSLLERSAHE